MHYAIRAEGLCKRFGETNALERVNLAVPRGSVLGLLGPNGAGKTTAVRVLATLLRPDAGGAAVAGYDVLADAHRVRRSIGLTGQYASVDEDLTGAENLLLIGRLLGLSRAQAKLRARELLADFDLAGAADRAASTYSGGMRRRLDLAASLVGHPPVLFLDEPTTGLDPRARTELWARIRGLVADGVTVLLTTQYLDEADELADELVVIDHGRVIASGTPAQLKAASGAQTLAVRPAEEGHLPAVTQAVADLAGVAARADEWQVNAPITDPAIAAAVLRRLDETGVPVAELALRSASLDEVFLTLTGGPAAGGEVRQRPHPLPEPAKETLPCPTQPRNLPPACRHGRARSTAPGRAGPSPGAPSSRFATSRGSCLTTASSRSCSCCCSRSCSAARSWATGAPT